MATIEEKYKIIVEKIFNNWTGLRLAVEHGMGGRNGQKTAIEIMNYMYEYCIRNSNVSQSELQEILEDVMDEEFDTVCEDNSILEISTCLVKYLNMCHEGKFIEIETELGQLTGKDWLRPDVKITYTADDADTSSSSDEDENNDESMEVDSPTSNLKTSNENPTENSDPEWTTVRSRRKK